MRALKEMDWDKYLLPVLLLAILIIFGFVNPAFLSSRNIVQTIRQGAVLFCLVCGQMLPLVTRGIDLSQGSVMSLTSIAILSFTYVSGAYLGSVFAILTGTACGFINGLLIAYLGIPAIIVTLSMLFFASGVALVYTGGVTLTNLSQIDGGRLFWFGGESLWVFPIPCLFAVLLGGGAYYLLKYSVSGRQIWFLGSNPEASFMSGVNIKRTVLIVYILSAFGASIASLFLTSRLCMGFPILGAPWLVLSIGGAVVGGVSVQGGKGGVWNAALGSAIMVCLDNGLIVSGFSTFAREAIIGALILTACSLSSIRGKN